jgi:hypothetical protein
LLHATADLVDGGQAGGFEDPQAEQPEPVPAGEFGAVPQAVNDKGEVAGYSYGPAAARLAAEAP